MAVYVVVGGSRGLGLETVAQLLSSDSKATVVATARAPEQAEDLQKLVKQYDGRLKAFKLDASSDASIKEAANAIGNELSDGIDALIFNAGKQEPWTTALDTSPDDFRDVLQVNTVAPFVAAVAFVPLLKLRQTRKIVFITSILGSIAAHHKTMFDEKRKSSHVGYLPYSASKAALNMVTTIIANQLQPEGFTVIALHPGHVHTDMGSRDSHIIGQAALTKETSVKGQLKVISEVTKQDTGKYLSYEGKELPY